MESKRIITGAFAALCLLLPCSMTVSAQDTPAGTVAYALPQTSISLEVEAVQEQFHAGPYARFAEKYLGIEAEQEDRTSYSLSNIKLTPCIEADPAARYSVVLPESAGNTFLQMTAQGLISISDGGFGKESVWRFPAMGDGGFSEKGLSSNLTTESGTLYRSTKGKDEFNRITVSQDIVVAKSLEQKAQEAADIILKLRKTRIQIVTGDTDATYSGEAMGAAIDELSRLEQEYLSLFIGCSEYQTQKVRYDVVPANDSRNHVYVAFRMSESQGLVPADDPTGKPYILDITEEGLTTPVLNGRGSASKNALLYRVPCICNVRLTDGVNLIMQTRIPIYQYGATSSFPLNK